MSLLALLLTSALAHPSAMRTSLHNTLVQVDPDRVRLVYEVEVPLHTPSDFTALASSDELSSAILVLADGVSVPLEVDEVGGTVKGHVHHTRIKLHGDLESVPRDVRVSIGNYPDTPAVFSWDAVIHRSLDVVNATNSGDGRERPMAPRRPQPGDGARELDLALDAGGLPERVFEALTPTDPAYRTVVDARHIPLSTVLRSSARSAGLFALLGALAAALGVSSTALAPMAHRATALAFLGWLVLASVAAMHPSLPWFEVAGGASLVLAAALTRASTSSASLTGALAVTLLACTARSGAAGFVLWTAWGVGRLLAARVRPGALDALQTALIVASGALLLARGAGELFL